MYGPIGVPTGEQAFFAQIKESAVRVATPATGSAQRTEPYALIIMILLEAVSWVLSSELAF